MLYAAAILFAARITVRFSPPEKGRGTVTVLVRTADSQPFSVQAKVVDGRLEGISIPESAQSVTVETPVHSPCELKRPFNEPCELKSLTVFEPFARGQTGSLWFRKAGDEKASWKAARRLSSEDGPGFALAEEALDLLLAPENEAASLHLGAFPSQLRGARGVRDEVDPAALVVRVVGQDGAAFGDRLRVSVMGSSGSPAVAQRNKAWKSFYETNGSSFEKDGLLRISPLPRESLFFSLQADGYTGVTISSRGRARDRVIDAGTIRLRRPISLTVVLESSVPADELPKSLSVSMRHDRDAAGFLTSVVPEPKAIRLAEPVEFKGLSPGVWRVMLGGDGALCGFREVNLAQPSDTIAMRLEMAQVEGVVRLRDETPVANAHVQVRGQNLSDGQRSEVLTDRDGHFQARFLHAGGVVYVVVFRDASDDGETVDKVDPTSAEAQSLRVTLRGGEVRVRVGNRETHRPIPEAWVNCYAPALQQRWTSRQTNAEGEASFGGLLVGDWTCQAKATGFAPQKTIPFRNSEDGVIEQRLDLSSTRILRGVVLGPSGPATGATVMGPFDPSPLDPEWWEPPMVQSSGGGRFEIPVPAGQSALLAFLAPGYRLDFVSVSPEDDEIQLTLSPRGPDSRIELVTEDGRPVRGAEWTLSRNGWRIPGLVLWKYLADTGCAAPATDSEGSVLYGGCLGPGNYRFLIRTWNLDADIPSEPVNFPAPPHVRLVVFPKQRIPHK